jgi:hypothetical protein
MGPLKSVLWRFQSSPHSTITAKSHHDLDGIPPGNRGNADGFEAPVSSQTLNVGMEPGRAVTVGLYR